jgi:hypothetical protein
MKSVLPKELHPSRVFFTEFDRVTYSQVAWSREEVDAISQNLERKVKLLTLTKGQIVIAASHLLESEIAHDFLFAYPDVLAKGIIVPSLRSEFSTCAEFLERKRTHPDKGESEHFQSEEATEVASMIDSAPAVVRWGVHDMSDWFKTRLLTDLRDEKGLIRLAIRNEGVILPMDLDAQIEKEKVLSRGAVYRIAKETKIKPLWDLICNYTDFLYYLSGARTTHSEGVLPQENLLDFSIGDLAGQQTRLSEYEVFFKLFIDVVKARTSTHFPTDMLDTLSMDDTVDLHGIAVSTDFTEKYNNIQVKTKEALNIHDPERLVLLMHELDEFERELHTQFGLALDNELTSRQREQKKTGARKLLHSLASLIIPYYDTPNTAADIVINGLELVGQRQMAEIVKNRIEQGWHACEKYLERVHIADKQVLLDFVVEVNKKYSKKMFGV